MRDRLILRLLALLTAGFFAFIVPSLAIPTNSETSPVPVAPGQSAMEAGTAYEPSPKTQTFVLFK